jgi:nucleoid DNA-binding protein
MANKTKTKKKAAAVPKLDLTKPAKVKAASKVRSKSEVYTIISDLVGVTRRQVAGVFHVLGSVIKADLAKGGPGVTSVPGLARIRVQRKPATKERQGINPFTKEPTVFKARPARNVVRLRPLRGLKEMV